MPTTFFVKTYGSYSFGDTGNWAKVQFQPNYRSRTAERPNRGGMFSAGTLFSELSLTIMGQIVPASNTLQARRDAYDALQAVFAPGGSQQLKIDSDRYINAEPRSFAMSEPDNSFSLIKWAGTLVSYEDPPWWDAVATTAGLTVAGSPNALTVAGTGPAAPVISIVVTAAPVNSTITILDQYGNSMVISPDAAGTFIIDSYAETITKSGVDKSNRCTGQFPMLVNGSSSLTITLAGGATASGASLSYHARHY
jgi:hypothetical protein